jgi:3-methyladenine DNA glycosylase AlkC
LLVERRVSTWRYRGVEYEKPDKTAAICRGLVVSAAILATSAANAMEVGIVSYQLKDGLGPDVAVLIATMIERVYPEFPGESFIADALDGYAKLELTDRARQLCRELRAYLPEDPERAIEILVKSLGPVDEGQTLSGMEPFRYLPYVYFVADYGLECFELSMRAQYELTQRFTAEFSIRAFLVKEPERTLAVLRRWAQDPSEHVRRLVSEGSRPRLPWAPRLRAFQADPAPVLELLELLKDDPSPYVRRSVANNLNDISKDHPELAIDVATRWSGDASPERRDLIRHALRGLIKKGHPGALAILGARHGADAAITESSIEPLSVAIGDSVQVTFIVCNSGSQQERFVIDYRVHFVKANGGTSPKVFKIATVDLESNESRAFSRKLSLLQRTTRTHYPGLHRVDAVINGTPHPIGEFTLVS